MCSLTLSAALTLAATSAMAFGNVTPREADRMVASGEAIILDVRTPQEWNWVGHPGQNKAKAGAYLEGKVVNVAYEVYHEGYSKGDVLIINTQFVKDVENLIVDKDITLITMCRSGGRSVKAAIALEEAGFTNVNNMLTGFEGSNKTAEGYRTLDGWKVDGLPYSFSGVGAYAD